MKSLRLIKGYPHIITLGLDVCTFLSKALWLIPQSNRSCLNSIDLIKITTNELRDHMIRENYSCILVLPLLEKQRVKLTE